MIYSKKKGKNPQQHVCSVYGGKYDDHNPIETFFINDLHEINNDVYSLYRQKGNCRPDHVYVHLIATICNFPEIYSRCGITQDSGNQTSCWEYLCNVNRLKLLIASCPTCFNKWKQHIMHDFTIKFTSEYNTYTSWSMEDKIMLSCDMSEILFDFNIYLNKKLLARLVNFGDLKKQFSFVTITSKVGDGHRQKVVCILTCTELPASFKL